MAKKMGNSKQRSAMKKQSAAAPKDGYRGGWRGQPKVFGKPRSQLGIRGAKNDS